MNTQQNSKMRKQGAILGALVADAASLGFHWLYDPQRIAQTGGVKPEFVNPNERHYENVPGFFAHPMKEVGELTHYGEQLVVGLRSLAENKGNWKPFHYLETFCRAFDRGGSFHGYIDGSTFGTLTNYRIANDSLMENAKAVAPDIQKYPLMVIKEFFQTKGLSASGNDLIDPILESMANIFEDNKTIKQVEDVVRYYEKHRTYILGADDNQVPAFSKLPALVACYAGDSSLYERVEEAIRITNNNDEAVMFSLFGARALEQVILGESITGALRIAADASDKIVKSKIHASLNFEYEKPAQLGQEFGMDCIVHKAFPVSSAILNKTSNYVAGIRENILVAGDNAGRSLFVGSMLGAAYGLDPDKGIPLSWSAKLKYLSEYIGLIDSALKVGE
jgi:ADP-ribosylglycohydrolase